MDDRSLDGKVLTECTESQRPLQSACNRVDACSHTHLPGLTRLTTNCHQLVGLPRQRDVWLCLSSR